MILYIRGHKIMCYAKDSTKDAYTRLYEAMSDSKLEELEEETLLLEAEQEQGYGKPTTR